MPEGEEIRVSLEQFGRVFIKGNPELKTTETIIPKYIMEKLEKKTRTPRTVESITAGALALQLEDQIFLCKKLKESITNEVNKAHERAKVFTDITKDL